MDTKVEVAGGQITMAGAPLTVAEAKQLSSDLELAAEEACRQMESDSAETKPEKQFSATQMAAACAIAAKRANSDYQRETLLAAADYFTR